MPLDSAVEKALGGVAEKPARNVEKSIIKAWSILDAASEKKPPSEYLSQRAIKAIQGFSQPTGA